MSFAPARDFSKTSSSVTHNYIWVPNTILNFKKKKLISQFRENLRTDGQGKDRPYFIGAFQKWPEVQKINVNV